MTDLGMNERAWALADDAVARTEELRIETTRWRAERVSSTRGSAVAGGFAAGRLLAEVCMGGLGHLAYRAADDRRRDVVRRAGVDRSPGAGVHGVAVRGLGHQP